MQNASYMTAHMIGNKAYALFLVLVFLLYVINNRQRRVPILKNRERMKATGCVLDSNDASNAALRKSHKSSGIDAFNLIGLFRCVLLEFGVNTAGKSISRVETNGLIQYVSDGTIHKVTVYTKAAKSIQRQEKKQIHETPKIDF